MECLFPRLLLAIFLLLAVAAEGERGSNISVRQDIAVENGDDEDDSPKLRVFSNNHRMSLNANDDPAVLSVYFTFPDALEVLKFRLPPGYEVVEGKIPCGIYTLGKDSADPKEPKDGKAFHKTVDARSLISEIDWCKVKERKDAEHTRHGETLMAVEVLMKLKRSVPGLSQDTGPGDDVKKPWWCFAMHVRNPKINPYHKDNRFSLHHWSVNDGTGADGTWDGEILTIGHEILGDWDCIYSEWEGWGQCNARCGGGTTRLTRRILLEPPKHVDGYSQRPPCADATRSVECNTFDCKFPCEFVELPPAGVCSSECGGGVKAVRPVWRGDGCPAREDRDAVQLERCNEEPCRVRCKLADTWTVVTPCSEPCGPGTYRMMRQVLEKDKDDTACQPEWREVPCVRSWCTPLSIIRPDRNILPYPGDVYYVGIAFKLVVNADQITLQAPGGYKFGEPGSDCWIHDHDLVPYYRGCKVGLERSPGTWTEEYAITLLLDGLLPKSDAGRYHFQIPVTNRKCDGDDYRQVLTVEDEPWGAEVCNVDPQYNQWIMRFRKEIVEDGKATMMEETACGYELHNPKQAKKRSGKPGSKDLFARTTNSNQFVTSGMDTNAWRARQIFCSPRLEPCPGGMACPPSGVCPPYDELGQTPHLMDDEDWNLNLNTGQAADTDFGSDHDS